jgi:hypothetical protein
MGGGGAASDRRR